MAQGYIHGYSRAEQRRLVEQARTLAPQVFDGLDLGGAGRLLELGCGVGAELDLIQRRWPGLGLTGLDRSPSHLAAARDLLAPAMAEGRVHLVQGDAERLPFADGAFERVITIWLLEHVRDPGCVLAEALRVLSPGGELICTEVDNRCFAFAPDLPAITTWWQRLNAYQAAGGGSPFVGGQLYRLARALGAEAIRTETLPIISSRLAPARREVLLGYLDDLLLSAAPCLLAARVVTQAEVTALQAAFAQAEADPAIEFHYFAVRLRCRPPGAAVGDCGCRS